MRSPSFLNIQMLALSLSLYTFRYVYFQIINLYIPEIILAFRSTHISFVLILLINSVKEQFPNIPTIGQWRKRISPQFKNKILHENETLK